MKLIWCKRVFPGDFFIVQRDISGARNLEGDPKPSSNLYSLQEIDFETNSISRIEPSSLERQKTICLVSFLDKDLCLLDSVYLPD